jgi:hypothetical protein
LRAEGEADADFAGAADDGVADDAVEADGGEQQGKQGEDAGERGDELLWVMSWPTCSWMVWIW